MTNPDAKVEQSLVEKLRIRRDKLHADMTRNGYAGFDEGIQASLLGDALDRIEHLEASLAARSAQVEVGEVVAWAEKDGDDWLIHAADSQLGEHIAKWQRQHHYVTLFPVFNRPAPPPTSQAMVAAPLSSKSKALSTVSTQSPATREARLEEALRDILNPLGRLQRMAEASGGRLDGAAYTIAHSLTFLQGIASAALAQTGGGEG